MSDDRKRLFLCLPLYGSMVHVRVAMRFFRAQSKMVEVHPMLSQSSLLARGFNCNWIQAQNEGFDYFLMLHGDVEPQPSDWVDILLKEMQDHQADIISAVVPIKDDSGRTSTAIGNPTNPWLRTHLMLSNCHDLPRTFGTAELGKPDHSLLVNTGCMLVDLSMPWVRDVHFTIRDRINDGVVECEPEDWYFSRRAWEIGAKVMATRAVPVIHHGEHEYRSW